MSTLDTVFEFKLSPSEATDEETLYTTLCSLIGERLGLRGWDVRIDHLTRSTIAPKVLIVHWSAENGRAGCALAVIDYPPIEYPHAA